MKILTVFFVFAVGFSASGLAQETTPGAPASASSEEAASESSGTSRETSAQDKVDEFASRARDLAGQAESKAEEIAERVDQDERAQKAAAGLLGKIYLLAESLSFSSFHWLAFALMSAGVVSFALQLVLGKLVLLFHGSLNIKEICSDAIGFVISTVGLVLTTQAAAENSEFTHSPAAVLSAALFGVVVGFTLYRWGQHQEINAVKGKK